MTPPDPLTPADEFDDDAKNHLASVIQTAQEAAARPIPVEAEKVYSVFVPKGGAVHTLDTEWAADHPRRATGTVELATVDGFNAYVKEHTIAGTSVYVHPTKGEVVAVLNDHQGGQVAASDQGQDASLAGWGDYRARLVLEHPDEWKFWLGQNNKLMSQAEFAEHIEVGQLEISEPDGATVLEVAQSMQATTTAAFKSALRLDNGEVQLRYEETIDATAGRAGQTEIPSTFKLAVRPFIGEEPFSLTARLRYRLHEGRLTIGYRIDRPDVAIRDAIELVAVRIRDAHERVYSGTPR